MRRREVLRGGVKGALALGIAKTLHNTVVGYGHFGLGKNLHTQDLDAIAREGMRPPRRGEFEWGGTSVRIVGEQTRYRRNGRWYDVSADAPAGVRELANDVRAIGAGDFSFRFDGLEAFFDSLANSRVRPGIVSLLRGRRVADPDTVEEAVGATPYHPDTFVRALATFFREQTRYDVPRYLAGSIDDNLIPVDANLREPFRPAVDLERLGGSGGKVGLFCTEYTRFAIATVHAIHPLEQTPPLYALYVRNARHKHVYNALGSAIRLDGQLILPMTFVDYTDAVLSGDFPLVGERLDAYDTRHRADEIRWF